MKPNTIPVHFKDAIPWTPVRCEKLELLRKNPESYSFQGKVNILEEIVVMHNPNRHAVMIIN
jgi:hypothetical protein